MGPSLVYSWSMRLSVRPPAMCWDSFWLFCWNQKIKGRALFRGLILIPWAIPTVVATANWLWILNDQSNRERGSAETASTDGPILFFADQRKARITCIVVGTWKSYPFIVCRCWQVSRAFREDVYESARMDGATGIKTFFYITLPMIRNVSMVVVTLMFIWGFNNFDIIYLLTQGGRWRRLLRFRSTHTIPRFTGGRWGMHPLFP